MTKTAWAILGALLLAAASGLADDQPRVAPPPLRAEAPTLQPSPSHVWIPGFWKWTGINYEWADGRWVKAKKNRVWVPGTWEQVGSRWAWKPGKWAKPQTDKPKAKKPPKNKKSE